MFSGNKRQSVSQEKPGYDTLVAKDVVVEGTVQASGTLRIDGSINGNVRTSGDVIVGEDGVVTAKVVAGNIVIAGEVHGNLEITGRLHILPGGRVFGDAKVDIFIVEEGAIFKGQCEMEVKRPGKAGERIAQRVDNTAKDGNKLSEAGAKHGDVTTQDKQESVL